MGLCVIVYVFSCHCSVVISEGVCGLLCMSVPVIGARFQLNVFVVYCVCLYRSLIQGITRLCVWLFLYLLTCH
mgnify:CR=1 FL=1